MPETISCDNCKAACCHGVYFEALEINRDVLETMRQLGGTLVDAVSQGEPSIHLLGWCPLLNGTLCSVHGNDNQRLSRQCLSFKPGSRDCLKFRNRDGIR